MKWHRGKWEESASQLFWWTSPRPSWHLAGEVIDGGVERWQHLSTAKTSHEKLVLLLNEFTGGGNEDDGASGSTVQATAVPDQLPAYGEGEHVPFHLRSSKSVKNRRLTRRDVAVLIQEIWAERRLSDKQVGCRSSCRFFFSSSMFRTVERKRCPNSSMNSFEIGMAITTPPWRWATTSIMLVNVSNTMRTVNCSIRFSRDKSVHADGLPIDRIERVFLDRREHLSSHEESHRTTSRSSDQRRWKQTEWFSDQWSVHWNLEEESSTEISDGHQWTGRGSWERTTQWRQDISCETILSGTLKRSSSSVFDLLVLFQDDEDNYGEFIRVFKRQLQEDKQRYIHDVQEKIENST